MKIPYVLNMGEMSTRLSRGKLMPADLEETLPCCSTSFPHPTMLFPLPLCSPRDGFEGITQKGWWVTAYHSSEIRMWFWNCPSQHRVLTIYSTVSKTQPKWIWVCHSRHISRALQSITTISKYQNQGGNWEKFPTSFSLLYICSKPHQGHLVVPRPGTRLPLPGSSCWPGPCKRNFQLQPLNSDSCPPYLQTSKPWCGLTSYLMITTAGAKRDRWHHPLQTLLKLICSCLVIF